MKSIRKSNKSRERECRPQKMMRCGIFAAIAGYLLSCSQTDRAGGHDPVSKADPSGSANVRILRRGNPGEPRTLDPQLADDEFSFPIIRDLFEGLTSESSSGEIKPGVAESWTIDSSGTIYTFRIRRNARWSNGDKIKAADFVAGMRRAVDPKFASGSAGLLSVIKNAAKIVAGRGEVGELGVTEANEGEVQIVLEHPAPFILQILSQPVCAPLHANLGTANQSDSTKNKLRISNGPYKFVRWVPGSYIDIARNPMYWRNEAVKVDAIRYVSEESETTELKQYLADELEITSTIPMPDFERMQTNHRQSKDP